MERLAFVALAVLVLALPFSCGHKGGGRKDGPQKDTVYPLGFLTDTLRLESSKVRSGDTFAGLMLRLGLPKERLYPLAQAADSVFDVRLIRADRPIDA